MCRIETGVDIRNPTFEITRRGRACFRAICARACSRAHPAFIFFPGRCALPSFLQLSPPSCAISALAPLAAFPPTYRRPFSPFVNCSMLRQAAIRKEKKKGPYSFLQIQLRELCDIDCSMIKIVIGMERGASSEVIENDVAPSTSSDGLAEAEPWYSDFDHVEYVPDDTGVIHVPAVTLLAPPQTAEPAREQTIEQQPPRQKRKSTSPPELVALLEEQKLMREDLKAARAKEYALRERQLVMQEKLYGAMTQYFNTHSAQK
ncbi:hypothetical protein HPB48_003006 [Haemaphysalis longicornis]|uniref:Uncharacterized protein n=1 Tax=Haemaphysalis longicornis TaxID=44386 RepID=A0A9J6FFM1_HAELO|nr:hypothetical protein HPB48_003006 [Haemaphysalis longicornis]